MFNQIQQDVITNEANHLSLIAGAGTGKTTVLIHKINYLVKKGIDPSRILAITFTRKAAGTIKKRLFDYVNVYTFDALCMHHIDLGDKRLIDEEVLPFSKEEQLAFNLYESNARIGKKPRGLEQYRAYKEAHGLVDFNDVERLFLEKLKSKKISFDYIFIDEFQDTNLLQFQIFKRLVSPNTKTMIVGDPDQSIYRFRGTFPNIIQVYQSHFNAQQVIMDINYRSSLDIIQKANHLIAKNDMRIPKILKAFKQEKGIVHYQAFDTQEEEAIAIIAHIRKQKNKSTAILYRNHERAVIFKSYLKQTYLNVSIMTIHEAKGLEFDCVYIIGVEKNTLPMTIEHRISELEEERRLMFVAMTRAKEKLYITGMKPASRFVKELRL